MAIVFKYFYEDEETGKRSKEYGGYDDRGFREGRAAVVVCDENGVDKYGFIDEQGIEICNIKYISVCDFDCGVALVEKRKGWFNFIDAQGVEICKIDFSFDRYDDYWKYSDFYVSETAIKEWIVPIINDDGKVGLLDLVTGQITCYPIYKEIVNIGGHGRHFIAIDSENKRQIIDQYGIRYSRKYNGISRFRSAGLLRVELNGLYGYIDISGEEVCSVKYDMVSDFVNGFAVVEKDGLYGYINEDGEEICPINLALAYSFGDNGYAKCIRRNIFGKRTPTLYIDENGEFHKKIPPQK